jgi:concanavalin A-like lectin/glucanase superfamily protein/uncharacterized protein DUF6298/collagenase-like protein with putative collagen-binding domain
MKHKIFGSLLLLLQLSLMANGIGMVAAPQKAMAAASGLVAAYGFEEGSGTILNDNSGNSNHGTLQNGPTWVTTGKFGKALNFDGNNDLVAIPDSNSLDLTTGMTLEAWVYPTANMSGWDTIILKEYSSGLVYALYANGDGNIPATFISNNNTEHGISGGSTLPPNTWSHVSATFNGSVIRLYINGTQVQMISFSGAIQTSGSGVGIGGNKLWANEGFPGKIDEVRIYNRALSASEIATDMQNPVQAGSPTATPSRTPTGTQTPLATATTTRTPTRTATSVFTATGTATAMNTLAATATRTFTPTVTRTNSPVPTSSWTPTLAQTPTRTPTSSGQTMGPLRIGTVNPRYFADPSGKAVLLTGSHTWCNFIDCGSSNPPPSFNYTAYLNFLVANHHNFFRLWRAENAKGGEISDNFFFAPMPYQRTGPGTALDGNPKFDVTMFNQAYFDRMRADVIAARDRGIYVSIMLFDGWSVESKRAPHHPWIGHPYNQANNINSVNGDPNGNGSGEEVQTLNNPRTATQQVILPLEEAYVRKVIDTVNDLDNVLYEISNETDGGGAQTAWENYMIDFVKGYEQSKPKQHPVGMTVQYPGGSNSDLFASHADWISPNGDINNLPVVTGSKVVIYDTDHLCGVCGNRQFAWKSFMRGGNTLFMDPYDGQATGRGAPSGYDPNNANDVSLRKNMGYTLDYATRMDLAHMTPHGELSSTGYCLAKPTATGAEYLVYAENGAVFTVNLSATSGTLTVEWFSPSTGTTTSGGTVSGGGTRSFSPAAGGDWVLYLKSLP